MCLNPDPNIDEIEVLTESGTEPNSQLSREPIIKHNFIKYIYKY